MIPPELLSLLRNKRVVAYASFTGLVVLVVLLYQRTQMLEARLAARPAVETKVQTRIVTKTVRGPERVVERFIKGEVVERIVYRDPVVTTSGAETTEAASSTPVGPPAGAGDRWRYAGILADPFAPTKIVGLRGGITLWNRLDLGVSGRFSPHKEGQAEIGVRF